MNPRAVARVSNVCRYGGMLGFAITATVIAFFGFTGFLGK
jgi:hypothetical protein